MQQSNFRLGKLFIWQKSQIECASNANAKKNKVNNNSGTFKSLTFLSTEMLKLTIHPPPHIFPTYT